MVDESRVINVKTDNEEFNLIGKPCNLSAFSFVPPERDIPPERTFYNSPKKNHVKTSIYDQIFTVDLDFNDKVHREDRRHAKLTGIDTFSEESVKAVPSMSSSNYGHYIDKPLEIIDRTHVRVAIVQSEFYRRNGIDNRDLSEHQ